jgi:hypothetical protein
VAINASKEASNGGRRRTPICSPFPVVFGRPRFFVLARIDAFMI